MALLLAWGLAPCLSREVEAASPASERGEVPTPVGRMALTVQHEAETGRLRLAVHNHTGTDLFEVRIHVDAFGEERNSPVTSFLPAGDSLVYRPLIGDMAGRRGLFPILARLEGARSGQGSEFSATLAILLPLGPTPPPPLAVFLDPASALSGHEVQVRIRGLPPGLAGVSLRVFPPPGVAASPNRWRGSPGGDTLVEKFRVAGMPLQGEPGRNRGLAYIPVIAEVDLAEAGGSEALSTMDTRTSGQPVHHAGIAWLALRAGGPGAARGWARPALVAFVLLSAGGLIWAGDRLAPRSGRTETEAEDGR